MRYEVVRKNIESGDVLAWSHKKWNSWYDIQVQIVRFFTQSEYCHVGIAWSFGGRLFVIEAVGSGVRIFPLSKQLPFYWIPTQYGWQEKHEDFAMSLIGAPYSKWRAVRAFFGIKEKEEESHAWECAELVLAVLSKNGIDLNCKATPTAVVYSLQERDLPCYLVQDGI